MTTILTDSRSRQQRMATYGSGNGGLQSVLIHPAGGGIGHYMGLISHLRRKGSVHAIRALGLYAGETPDNSIAVMKKRYSSLLQNLPEQPRLFVGWSLGGVLAWELAAEVAAERDAPPPAVVLIDSFAKPWSFCMTEPKRLCAEILHHSGPILNAAARERAERVTRAHVLAASGHHVVNRHTGRSLLLSCAGPERTGQVESWRKLDPGIEIETLNCGHFEIFNTENIRSIVQLVEKFSEPLL